MEASALDLSPDHLETILEDGEFVLYRSGGAAAADTTSARSVLVVMPRSEHPRPQTIRMLENEHSLRDELDPAWATRSLALTTREGRAALVLEDPGGEPLARRAGTPMDVGEALRVGASLAAALRQLHVRGLIHKDIKPANVMTDGTTGQVWLRGFGIASRLLRERQTPDPPEFIAGTLAYMAPEQTGRMNRSIDSRGDLYSLGVTLYELATGTLPFTATDPMEWVHCHIARQPMPPRERVPALPSPLSAIILKLLAKAPEDRYQTAAGVEVDLRRCLAEWEARGRVDEFPLGARDRSDRLLMPEKLYGRERERQILLDAFDQVVATGTPHLVLVSGYSGIGKSAVVNELHRAIVLPRGIFISGKFDQYKRDVPYATIAQAFQALIRQILSASNAEVDRWREQICEAVGPNGQLIVNLIPELELVLGKQVPVPELPPTEAESRFHLVFRSFLGVFARQEHPLALFLDDLQWLDTATLKLLEDVMTRPDVEHLLLIGAYRDNEVSASHPLMRTVEAVRQTRVTVRDIVLAPLSLDDVTEFVTDTLHHEHAAAGPLARLVYQRTLGNPFFAIQFLTALRDERLLAFDAREAFWRWDLDRIRARGFTDNVVDLMIGKLERLPSATQEALKELACLGNSADIATLSLVRETSEDTIHADLWEALRLEFIQRADDAYRFVHDRVQEAAYSLIPAGARGAAHLRIGRLLASRMAPAEIDEKIFEIVSQLNRGADLIASAEERARVAELNLMAGKRAKMSTAYASAIAYLTAGRALLKEENWDQTYDLIFAIELQTAECEVLTARMTPAEERLSMLATRARHASDVAAVARLRLTLYTTLDRSDRGVEVCLEYLQRGGTTWSPHPTVNEVRREYDRIWSQLGDRSIEALIDLPLIRDRDALAAVDVLTEMVTPALFTDENLVSLVICRMVNLSLEHGNSDGSCFAYVWLGIIAGPRFGDYRAGFRFGRLGYDLVEQRGLKRFQARTYMCFGNIVMPWTKHIKTGRELVRRAFEAANRVGDLTFAAYSCVHVNTNFLAAGDPLVDVQHEATVGLEFAEKARFGLVIDILRAQIGLTHSLRGFTTTFGLFDTDEFDEQGFEHHLASNAVLALPECWYWIRKLQARFFAGDYASALDASAKAQRLLWTSPSLFEVAEYEFYTALARAASCETATANERQEHVAALASHQRQLAVWAENCPENFENRAALVGAEIARLDGRPLDAEHLYEQAIRSAQANGFVHNEALAHELAARFYLARGFEKIAATYMREARYGYVRWGADGKVRQLDELHPYLRDESPWSIPATTIVTSVEHLDLATVIKVSQAVSSEIVLEKLLDTLMRTAIEHAGAERGVLIVPQGDELWIQAEGRTTGSAIAVRVREMAIASATVPESVVRYAARAHESVRLDEASTRGGFESDDYVRRERALSVLCLPLLQQGQLMALLYLENNLAVGVFTPARMAVLNVLAAQAATSLERTRLFQELQQREAKIRRLVDADIIGVYFWDFDGRIFEANDAFLGMIGYDRDDLAAGRIRGPDLTPPEWRERTAEMIRQHKMHGHGGPFEKEYFRKDGSRVPVLLGAATFEDGGSQGVAFVLDLTERKRAEAAQKRAELELQQAWNALAHRQRVSMLGEVAASLAHEIRQPIAAARIDARVCIRALADDRFNVEAAREAASRMVKDAMRADEIIKRTTALYKKDTLQRERVDINAMIREMVALFQQDAAASSISIHTRLVDGIPPVMADRVQLQQVFMNLALNAIDAMKGTVGELTITSQLREGGEVLIGVSDTGVGLPADNPDQIFESFVTTKPDGTGMGLTITRSIVESHGGRLWATANTGPGATFLFTLRTDVEEPR